MCVRERERERVSEKERKNGTRNRIFKLARLIKFADAMNLVQIHVKTHLYVNDGGGDGWVCGGDRRRDEREDVE